MPYGLRGQPLPESDEAREAREEREARYQEERETRWREREHTISARYVPGPTVTTDPYGSEETVVCRICWSTVFRRSPYPENHSDFHNPAVPKVSI